MRINLEKTWEKLLLLIVVLFAIFGIGAAGYLIAQVIFHSASIGWGSAVGVGGAGTLVGGLAKAISSYRKKAKDQSERADEETGEHPPLISPELTAEKARTKTLAASHQTALHEAAAYKSAFQQAQTRLAYEIKQKFTEIVRLHGDFENLQQRFNYAILQIQEKTVHTINYQELSLLLQRRFPSEDSLLREAYHSAVGRIKDNEATGSNKTEKLQYFYTMTQDKILDQETAMEHYAKIYQEKYQLNGEATSLRGFTSSTQEHLNHLVCHTRNTLEIYKKLLFQFLGCLLANAQSRECKNDLILESIGKLIAERSRPGRVCGITLPLSESIISTPHLNAFQRGTPDGSSKRPPILSPGALKHLTRHGGLLASSEHRSGAAATTASHSPPPGSPYRAPTE